MWPIKRPSTDERRKANVSFSVLANHQDRARKERAETRTGVVSGDQVAGAQVAQHGGEIGEANDWCRLHGLALQSMFRSTTPAVTCEPLNPSLALGNDVFMFLYVHRLTHIIHAPN